MAATAAKTPADKPAGRPRCRCGKPAAAGELCRGCNWEAVRALVAAAVAAGTHSTAPAVRVCHGCGEWRPLWHKTEGGKELCRDCTPEGDR